MDDSNDPSTIQSNNVDTKHNQPNDAVKSNLVLNGNQIFNSNHQLYPGKTVYEMTPGPKKYQNIKKSPDKEPKFVPYEPYKAAVRSIVPELSQPSVAIFKRRLSTASNCSKVSNIAEDKENVIETLTQEKRVKILLILFNISNCFLIDTLIILGSRKRG